MPTLLERYGELKAIERLLEAALAGSGGALMLTGPAGIGKSSLLNEARSRAARQGMTVLTARAVERERGFAFGVVRQLLEAHVRRLPAETREQVLSGSASLAAPIVGVDPAEAGLRSRDPRHAQLLGLYWLVANLAELRPILLAADDVHWADARSLDWLAFAARRLDGTRAALLLTARSDEPGADRHLDLEPAGVRTVSPTALGVDAVTVLLAARLSRPVELDLANACLDATRGNPLLVGEFARMVTEDGVARRPGITSHQLKRQVADRLERLGHDARRLAMGVALLGRDARLYEAAQLADIALEAAARAADLMRRAELLDPGDGLVFAHPLVAQAVYESVPPGERAMLHGRAARLLAAGHACVEAVAGHLLHSEPASDPWAVEQLRSAGERALERGAPEAAVALLTRAAKEAVDGDRAGLLCALGVAEARLVDPAALGHLREALELAHDRGARAAIARVQARALIMLGQPDEAFTVMAGEVEALRCEDRESALQLEAELCATARLVPGWAERTSARLHAVTDLPGSTAGERAMLAGAAGEIACQGVSAARATDLARRALGDGELLQAMTPESPVFYLGCITLIWCDRYEEALRHLQMALEEARRQGSLVGVAHAETWRAEALLHAGRLAEAAASADAALEASGRGGTMIAEPLAVAWRMLSLLEQDRATEAESLLAASPWSQEVPPQGAFSPLVFARGALRLARHDASGACEQFLEAGRTLLRDVVPGPVLFPWRSYAAWAHHALGERAAARALAEEEATMARRFGAPRAHGIALRTLAAVGPAEQRVDLNRAAVDVLANSEARLDHAYALCDLGTSLRQTGARRESREPLSLAVDLALRCGATTLARHAVAELAASGARPRRLARYGRDALTPAELRVAQLAEQGLSNRAIAQALFVSIKTIETQLGHAYAKLGVGSRHELSAALEAEQAGAA